MTEVILEVFNSPFGKGFGINTLVKQACRVILTGMCTVRGINTELDALAVYIFGKSLDSSGEVDLSALKLACRIS